MFGKLVGFLVPGNASMGWDPVYMNVFPCCLCLLKLFKQFGKLVGFLVPGNASMGWDLVYLNVFPCCLCLLKLFKLCLVSSSAFSFPVMPLWAGI
jgi:hypothetical protein